MNSFLLDKIIDLALMEDSPHGDITSESIFEENQVKKLIIRAEEEMVYCGNFVVSRLVRKVDQTIKVAFLTEDGTGISKNSIIMVLTGEIKKLLLMERPILNFISRLSGIATLTAEMVEIIRKSNLPIKLLDTRKTTPGWRILEKYAVRCGGGYNHRYNLSEGVLIKDNHKAAAGGVEKAIKKVREKVPHVFKIEVEVDNLEEFREALKEKPDIILLDNFSPEMVREAVKEKMEGIEIEVSGGITRDNLKEYLIPGVDYISSGFLTYGAIWKKITAELE